MTFNITATEAAAILRTDARMRQWMSEIAAAVGAGGLTPIGTATGPIGSSTVVPVVTIDIYGRVTALTSASITAGTNYWKVASSVLQVDTSITPAYTKIELDASADISAFPGTFFYINPGSFFQVDAHGISFTLLSGTFDITGIINAGSMLNANGGVTVPDVNLFIQDDLDPTKQAKFQAASISTGTIRTFTLPDRDGTLALAAETHSLTAQTADIADTNFTNSSTAGLYRVHVYLLDTTAAIGAGAVTANIKYTDAAQAQTLSSSAVVLTTAGSFTQATFFVQKASGSISYGVTHTGIFSTSAYAFFTTCERLT